MKPVDPELKQALADNPISTDGAVALPEGTPIHTALRHAFKPVIGPLVEYWGRLLPPADQYRAHEEQVPVKGGHIAVRCLTPGKGGEGNSYPVLVWFHGGGWVVGDYNQDDNHLRSLCVALQLIIVNVEYRLAPEHQFPVSFEDCYASVKWVSANAMALGASLAKGFLVGGDSAGANIAAAVALQARDDPSFVGAPITGQYLREPVVVHVDAWPERYKITPSSWDTTAEDSPLLPASVMRAFYDITGGDPTDVRFSPLLAPSHAGLPPAFIQVMQLDVLRDDGIAYGKALKQAGVAQRTIEYPGVFHATHFAFPALKITTEIARDTRDGLKWLLEGESQTRARL